MRQFLLIVIILFLGACSQKRTKAQDSRKPALSEGQMFAKWLAKHELEEADFVDTLAYDAFEIWAYGDVIDKSDSLLYWYPSKDSSYYLVSNYNTRDGTRLNEDILGIEIKFHKSGSNDIRIGLLLPDSLSERKVDFHWRDKASIYILEELYQGINYEMRLLDMKHDSVWIFKTKN